MVERANYFPRSEFTQMILCNQFSTDGRFSHALRRSVNLLARLGGIARIHGTSVPFVPPQAGTRMVVATTRRTSPELSAPD